MELLSAAQIREWDAFTCQHQHITSWQLMERAAQACLQWLDSHEYLSRTFLIFCAKGNNGGDGLALARLLRQKNVVLSVYILESDSKGSGDFQSNLSWLKETSVPIHRIQSPDDFPFVDRQVLVIDALYGSGLNRPLEGTARALVDHLNKSGAGTISIDIPSGMFAGESARTGSVIRALHTLTFQVFKIAFLVPENEENTGQVHVLEINLDPAFLDNLRSGFGLIDEQTIRLMYKPRKPFSHKGTYGHALLVAGSWGKMGAAVLCSHSCLRSGVGLLSCHVPRCGYDILQTAVPEAMLLVDPQPNQVTKLQEDLSKFDALGLGPGLGTGEETAKVLAAVLQQYKKPVVIDADALNILSRNQHLYASIPAFSILTPHPKEFERLFGATGNDFERLNLALQKARELKVIIVLKGHHTFVAMPGGKGFFNMTGNAGMATGGSGDVLTGLLTGLLAQKYQPAEAALLGVYLHGLAGDLAAAEISREALLASDITAHLGKAFLCVQQL